jgi:hypothetical protein
MYRILIVVVAAATIALGPIVASAKQCGIGDRVFPSKETNVQKLGALTTNFWTFKGISTTFEIAGCTESDNIFKKASTERIRHYAGNNLDHLAVDMARGDGEYLEALAYLIEIDAEDRAPFRALTRARFETLFAHDRVTSDEMLEALRDIMSEHEDLSEYVRS